MRWQWAAVFFWWSVGSAALAAPDAPLPAAGAAPPASAAQLIDAFDSLCMTTQGDPTAALKQARAAGYGDGPLTTQALPMFSAISSMTRLSIETPDTKALFVVGRGPSLQFGSIQTLACLLAVTPPPGAELRAAMRAHLGIDPANTRANQDTYSFAAEDTGRHPIAMNDNAAIKAAITAGTYRAVLAGTLGQNASHPFDVLILLIPHDRNVSKPAPP